MSFSNNHGYDFWANSSGVAERQRITKYSAHQELIKQKYIEDIDSRGTERRGRNQKIGERQLKYQGILNNWDVHPLVSILTIETPKMESLPKKSWFLSFKFRLATPIICKDDETFYLHDNPFHKEKVFKVPLYPASSWKGRLR